MGPEQLEELKKVAATLSKGYPDLRLTERRGSPVIVGSFPVRHKGKELDRFSVEISFPDGPGKLPSIREVGGRVPNDVNRHINWTGDICADVPELILLRRPYSLLGYLDNEVRNFFLSQLAVEVGEPFPFGEWAHGRAGLLEAYGQLLGVEKPEAIEGFLDFIQRKKLKGYSLCPCGSGEVLRKCHLRSLESLRRRISKTLARQMLGRLKTN